MASQWLKFSSDLPEKPEVAFIAESCGLDVYSVAGRLMAVWHWISRQSEDGRVTLASPSDRDICHGNVTVGARHDCAVDEQLALDDTRAGVVAARAFFKQIDRIAEAEGFAKAMASAGWLLIEDGAIRCKDWDKHNSSSAKERAKNAERQQRKRGKRNARHGSTVTSVTVSSRSGRDAARDKNVTIERESLSLSERERDSLEKGERADAAAPPARGRGGGAAGARKPRKGRGANTTPPAPDPKSMREPRCIAEARKVIAEQGDPEAETCAPIEAVLRMCAAIRSDAAAMDHLRTACEALGRASDELDDLMRDLGERRKARKAKGAA